MSQDIEYFRGKYADSLDEVETLVAPLRRGEVPPDDVSARLTDVDAAIKTATGVKKSYSLELRLLRDRAVRAEYETALAKLNAKCEQLEADALLLSLGQEPPPAWARSTARTIRRGMRTYQV